MWQEELHINHYNYPQNCHHLIITIIVTITISKQGEECAREDCIIIFFINIFIIIMTIIITIIVSNQGQDCAREDCKLKVIMIFVYQNFHHHHDNYNHHHRQQSGRRVCQGDCKRLLPIPNHLSSRQKIAPLLQFSQY